jgi:hypothetical protein
MSSRGLFACVSNVEEIVILSMVFGWTHRGYFYRLHQNVGYETQARNTSKKKKYTKLEPRSF